MHVICCCGTIHASAEFLSRGGSACHFLLAIFSFDASGPSLERLGVGSNSMNSDDPLGSFFSPRAVHCDSIAELE